jgi:hypothetical protein
MCFVCWWGDACMPANCRSLPLLLLLLPLIVCRVYCIFAAAHAATGAQRSPFKSTTRCNEHHCCRSPVAAVLLLCCTICCLLLWNSAGDC